MYVWIQDSDEEDYMGEEEEEDDDEDNEDDEQEEEEGMIFKNYLYRLFLPKILKIYNIA